MVWVKKIDKSLPCLHQCYIFSSPLLLPHDTFATLIRVEREREKGKGGKKEKEEEKVKEACDAAKKDGKKEGKQRESMTVTRQIKKE